LNRIKLIAEPWDLETYQVGGFPIDWSEWNGKFRDTVRKFAKGEPGQIRDLRYRLSGSPDLYEEDGRTAYNSINFVTSHDGFTLNDLVSYENKHNEENLDNNKDGQTENSSWNCSVEGETNESAVLDLRKRLAKNYICCLFLSSGTPMLLGGDEFLRTQKGNNNAYCQDNELSWFNWDLAEKNSDFLNFCRQMIDMANTYKVLQMRKYSPECLTSEITCFEYKCFGRNLDEPAWDDTEQKTLVLYLYTEEKNKEKYAFFAIFNSDSFSQQIRLPELSNNRRWRRKIDTSLKSGKDFAQFGKEILIDPPEYYIVNPYSTVILIGAE
jgi:glycogen operon protein